MGNSPSKDKETVVSVKDDTEGFNDDEAKAKCDACKRDLTNGGLESSVQNGDVKENHINLDPAAVPLLQSEAQNQLEVTPEVEEVSETMDDVKQSVSEYEKAVINDDRYVESMEPEGDKIPLNEGEKQVEAVMRVTIHTIEDITRETDVGTNPDPFVEISANQVFLGATQVKANSTTADVAESFYIKTKTDPHKIKLKFNLKDKDHMEDDPIGHGYFDLGEEDTTSNQVIHMKWKGQEVGIIRISVDFQNVVTV